MCKLGYDCDINENQTTFSLYSISILISQPSKFYEYVGNKMPWRFQNFSVCLGNTLAEKTAEDSAETFVNYVVNGFDIPRYFAEGYNLVF